jgi:hypothetical protein
VKYAIDTEFIDTPTCSALISLGIVAEDGRRLYFEFDFPERELTPWLKQNVVPHLEDEGYVSKAQAAAQILSFIGDDMPEFWAYYVSYDWYWFSRVFGGFMNFPQHWPMRPKELADYITNLPNVAGAEHNALNDAASTMAAVKQIRRF